MAIEKSWQARIAEATDQLAASFVESISYDRRLYKQDIAGSIAHATMLARVKLISDADRDAIIDGLRSIEADIEANRFNFDPSLEDIHMVVEAALIERIGEPGRRLHTGRSRNDQVAMDFILWIRSACADLIQTIVDLQKQYVTLAERSMDIVLPAYTHVQRAQPIGAAAEALAWASMLERDRQRFAHVERSAAATTPLGSGAIAGTSLPLDKKQVVAALDQVAPDGPPDSSIELTASRDAACDFLFAAAMTAQHLSRWAEQWILYISTEFSFLRIADRYTTGSSMMPQKRNPDMLELIRGRCGNIYGDLVALMTILKGLPIAYNRDLQEDKRIVFRAFDTLQSSLVMAAAIAGSATYAKENIQPTLERGFLDATSLAEYLVTRGVPFRTAHRIVGALVARCEKEGKPSLARLPLETIAAAVKENGADASIDASVFGALGAENVVQRYRSAGAAGGEPLREQLERWRRWLGMA